MLYLQNISYIHPDKERLFENIHLTVNSHDKIALVGNNGVGKSTFLKIIAGELQPSAGQVHRTGIKSYYVPQIFGQYNDLTVGQALRIGDKLQALKEILEGHLTDRNLGLLDDDWTIEERCNEALEYWQLTGLELTQRIATLSGGQKTKVFLAGMLIHQPGLVLLDEPSNHLDVQGRQLLYSLIQSTASTMIVVSHDRKLLNLLDPVCELGKEGITVYGGSYDFYAVQKQLERHALKQDIHSREKALRKAREKERETIERQQKLDARGKGKQEKEGVARIMMNTLRNKAENSTAKTKAVHADKIGGLSQELHDLRAALPGHEKIRFGFDNSDLHKGKILFTAAGINCSYNNRFLWKENLHFQIRYGERIALKGTNGAGKTTLIHVILGTREPDAGTVYRAGNRTVYIDQEYTLVNNALRVYEQAQTFNVAALQEHEIKTRLDRFLFTREDWDKPCSALSGGEKMRLGLCCLTISNQSPDIIVLDEPTNNLDIQNIEILTAAINQYQGTLLTVSHDESFLAQTRIERIIQL
ncbi:MAG: ABC-F family ATP-binding cassette domain-containing protein [Williamsia sp.]|nr:ABC-F family ATP-binding cassette domain-containing protein [Williamsia sp.]